MVVISFVGAYCVVLIHSLVFMLSLFIQIILLWLCFLNQCTFFLNWLLGCIE